MAVGVLLGDLLFLANYEMFLFSPNISANELTVATYHQDDRAVLEKVPIAQFTIQLYRN